MNGIKKILIFILTAVFVFSAVIPFASYANAELDEKIEAEAFIVTDASTGQILYAKNHEKAEIPANLTKISNCQRFGDQQRGRAERHDEYFACRR